jgi:hypothetical protein
MRIKFLRNAEYPQIKPNGEPDPERSKSYKAGETYEVAEDHGNRWLRRNAAVIADEPHKSKAAESADESPLSDENVTDAIDLISRMKSKERLQHIVATDKRVSVQKAAQARLEALSKEGGTIEHMVPTEKR